MRGKAQKLIAHKKSRLREIHAESSRNLGSLRDCEVLHILIHVIRLLDAPVDDKKFNLTLISVFYRERAVVLYFFMKTNETRVTTVGQIYNISDDG